MTEMLFTKVGLHTPAQYQMEADGKTFAKDADGRKIIIKPAKGTTNAGIRRAAAQWAGRCGCKLIIDLANNGRWKSHEIIAVYMGAGAKRRAEMQWAHGVDPIFKTWVWKPVTISGSDEAYML